MSANGPQIIPPVYAGADNDHDSRIKWHNHGARQVAKMRRAARIAAEIAAMTAAADREE